MVAACGGARLDAFEALMATARAEKRYLSSYFLLLGEHARYFSPSSPL
jgi:hypothetical protein